MLSCRFSMMFPSTTPLILRTSWKPHDSYCWDLTHTNGWEWWLKGLRFHPTIRFHPRNVALGERSNMFHAAMKFHTVLNRWTIGWLFHIYIIWHIIWTVSTCFLVLDREGANGKRHFEGFCIAASQGWYWAVRFHGIKAFSTSSPRCWVLWTWRDGNMLRNHDGSCFYLLIWSAWSRIYMHLLCCFLTCVRPFSEWNTLFSPE